MDLMNAAGSCKDLESFRKLAFHPNIDQVTVGSYTPEKSVGFPDAYFYDKKTKTSYNAKQMPNCGLDEFLKELPEYIAIAKEAGKKLRISLAAPTTNAFVHMFRAILACAGADARIVVFEFNPACPNDKQMFNAYDPGFIELLVHVIGNVRSPQTYCAMKLSPVTPSVPFFLPLVSALQSERGVIQEVVACNTYPDALHFKSFGSDLFKHRNRFAAMGGAGLYPIALAMMRALEPLLLPDIELTACGGIDSAHKAQMMHFAGAWRFQVGTAYLEESITIFDRIGKLPND